MNLANPRLLRLVPRLACLALAALALAGCVVVPAGPYYRPYYYGYYR